MFFGIPNNIENEWNNDFSRRVDERANNDNKNKKN